MARCPSCSAFFCRECVTEHEGRIICKSCLGAIADANRKRGIPSATLLWTAAATAGFLFAWMFFYYAGLGLARIPSDFHSGGLK